MDGLDLINDLTAKMVMLDKAVAQLKPRGMTNVEADTKYRIALAQKMLEEREAGTPVTILSDICRGDKEIAKLRFDKEVADVVYTAAIEGINALKLQIKILNAQIEREWGKGGSL